MRVKTHLPVGVVVNTFVFDVASSGRDIVIVSFGGRQSVRDIISDFESGQDKIELVEGLSFGALSFQGNRISIAQTGSVIAVLTGVDTTALNAADFIYNNSHADSICADNIL